MISQSPQQKKKEKKKRKQETRRIKENDRYARHVLNHLKNPS